MTTTIKVPKKLIEVALPLDVINVAAAREKSIRHGHPSTLHLWWARRPLAAARAVLFAQLVNDPGYERALGRGVNQEAAEQKRLQLFALIGELVQWENTNNEQVLARARAEIWASWRETCALNRDHPEAAILFDPEVLPAFHDPFAGGGSIPLEAQRLGLVSFASDLNPVAVMINKAMIEIPPKFAGRAPVGPLPESERQGRLPSEWAGARGLAEDVRRYGAWMRDQAWEQIGDLYPSVTVSEEMAAARPDLAGYVGESLTVIAWLWARTVRSPNPAFSSVAVPLAASFVLSKKKGKEAWVEPVVEGSSYRFVVRKGPMPADALEETVNRKGGVCLLSGAAMPFKYIREEGKAGRMGAKLMAIVAEGKRGRVYLSPIEQHLEIPDITIKTNVKISKWPGCTNVIGYGMETFADLFTPRQKLALTTFSDLVQVAKEKVIADAKAQGMADDGLGLEAGGVGATAYGEAVAVYLGLAISRLTNTINALVVWSQSREQTANLFSRQAIPMKWDFAEVNPFAGAAGDLVVATNSMKKIIQNFLFVPNDQVVQQAVQDQNISINKVISTDPPYYDNVPYADLSDFFYVWMRKSIKNIYPSIFSTLSTPKEKEIIASPSRHGNKKLAEAFFMEEMKKSLANLAKYHHPAFPVTIYYAFKQSESKDGDTSNIGWETFLEAVINTGFSIQGTWPMRTERPTGVKVGINALASSIILVCRKRPANAPILSRREFLTQLRETFPQALEIMIGGKTGQSPIAPVDLAQAAIGPGIGLYSQHRQILNQDGSPMPIREALIQINRAISEHLNPDAQDLDPATRFCADWFQQYGWQQGPFGEADTLSRAKGTSIDTLRDNGILHASGGKVGLIKQKDYPDDWQPVPATPIWQACHHLIRSHQTQNEAAAGKLLAQIPEKGEPIRQLAYYLYTQCEQKKWAEEARTYNELISAWTHIVQEANAIGMSGTQGNLV